MRNVGLLGDFAKGFVIMTLAIWIFAIIGCVAMGQTGMALLLLVTLMIPLSTIAYEYLRNRRKERN